MWSMSGRPKAASTEHSAPGPGQYGVPNDTFIRKSSPKVFMEKGPRGTPDEFKGQAPDPCAYLVTPEASRQGKLISKAARSQIQKDDDDPGPGEYPLKTTVGEGPRISLAKRLARGQGVPDPMGPAKYNPDDSATRYVPPACRLNHSSSRSSLAAVNDTPGPGTYVPKSDFDSTQRRVTTRSWKAPVVRKTPKGALRPSSSEGSLQKVSSDPTTPKPGMMKHYSLMGTMRGHPKLQKSKTADLSSTAKSLQSNASAEPSNNAAT